MRTTAKWLLGVVTVWLPVYLAFLFAAIVVSVGEGDLPDAFVLPTDAFLGLQLSGLLLLIGLLIGYLFHVTLNERLGEDEKERWFAALLLGNAFAMPVYWWRHVRPAPEPPRRAPERMAPHAAPPAAEEWPLALGPSPRGMAAPVGSGGQRTARAFAAEGDGDLPSPATTPPSPARPPDGVSTGRP